MCMLVTIKITYCYKSSPKTKLILYFLIYNKDFNKFKKPMNSAYSIQLDCRGLTF